MKISLPNLNDMDFRLLESTEKKNGGSGITPSYFPALTNMTIFGHFSLYRDYKFDFYLEGFNVQQ